MTAKFEATVSAYTDNNLECCAYLVGVEDTETRSLVVKELVYPKQKCTSYTVSVCSVRRSNNLKSKNVG